ncbi:HTTM domain-containing protein [Portibacter marinus]|uniref:HTTM domain-containing protein n=1 Tax=Portibacter marinus TaxID=2898660 RepID=UPI001F30F626|nr:HTTM domain-containing protein [Portibacter marinus]
MLTATNTKHASPLATFRIFFGLMMFASIIRFWANGWIEKLYLEPSFQFKYYGFEWVSVPAPSLTYGLFTLCALSALCISLGFKYRWSMAIFFLSFTYIELMDKTTYLNHYYFISVLSLMMIFLPMNRYFSWDARNMAYKYVPAYSINALKILIAIVYIYAGLAKLNSDWMLKAMPLSIWLPSKYSIPFLGDFLHQKWAHYFFSWAGAIYDLFIVFFLLYKPTRVWAYLTVIIFHMLTGVLFPIGMFPYVMIVSTLIFFDAPMHQRILTLMAKLSGLGVHQLKSNETWRPSPQVKYFLSIYLIIQILLPLRFLAYPGKLFWTEQGYRFSWRVMLMEKAGYAEFKVVDAATGKSFKVDNSDFLTAFQEKQMATQPDFIVEYAHFLGQHFTKQGHENIEIYVESYVALNGEKSKPFIDPNVNLLEINDSFAHRNWVLPFND